MMIICIPTIPGLFQRHRARSTARSVSGASNQVLSSRSRISKLGITGIGSFTGETDNKHIVNNNYFELVDPKMDRDKDRQVTIKILSGSAQSDASVEIGYAGGHHGAYSDGFIGGFDNRTSDGILKTATVEQSRF